MEADERRRAELADGGTPPIGTTEERTSTTEAHAEAPTETPAPNERCAHHAGRPAVARCDACGEPVCIACAIPVRGRVLGPGCVAAELGDPALVAPPDQERRLSGMTVAGGLVALVGTCGPWTRTGAGDRPFGAWVPDVRWSMMAAVAAVALTVAAWWARRRGGSSIVPVVAAAAVVALIGSVGSIVFPPTFQSASWGPWVTGAGAALALAGVVLELSRETRDRRVFDSGDERLLDIESEADRPRAARGG